VTTIDIPAIAETLAQTHLKIPAGTTVKTGGRAAAEAIEGLIDAAAQAGAFTDLADRPSIEVSTLTHADRTVWVLLEFDSDRRLLRAGPVPVGELADTGSAGTEDIAVLLGRIRRLMSTAVLLDTSAVRSPLLTARVRRSQTGPVRLTVTGAALDEAIMEAARRTRLDAHDQPAGDTALLGSALAAVCDNPLTKAQAHGPDPIPAHIQALWHQADQAEAAVAAEHLPAHLDLPSHAATALIAALIDAFATPDTGHALVVQGPVAVACRKRRDSCAEAIGAASRAQQFVFERAAGLPHRDAVETRRWVDGIHAYVIRATDTALLLTDLAETAERHGEPLTARTADTEADRFAYKAEHATANAWLVAVETLHLTTPARDRENVVAEWERRTGWHFAVSWDRDQ
jgi:hypothetical protein